MGVQSSGSIVYVIAFFPHILNANVKYDRQAYMAMSVMTGMHIWKGQKGSRVENVNGFQHMSYLTINL